MKKLNKLNIILAVLFIFISIITTIVKKDFILLLFIGYVILPFLLKVKPVLTILYLIFGFIAMFLGNMVHLFRTIYWFDSFSHFLWGILSSLMAIYILDKLHMWNANNILFNLLFIFVFSLATSGLWEVCEFAIDNIIGGDMQRRATGIFDTMKDIVVALLGNILFLLWFYYEYKEKKNLFIHKFVETMNKD